MSKFQQTTMGFSKIIAVVFLFVGSAMACAAPAPPAPKVFNSSYDIVYPQKTPPFKDPATFIPARNVYTSNITNIYQINVNTKGEIVSNTSSVYYIPDDSSTNVSSTRIPLWWDEFDGEYVDLSAWLTIDGSGSTGWGNGELQVYSHENVYLKDGMLNIMAFRDANGNWTSGRVHSRNAWSPGMDIGGKTVSKIYFESLVIIPQGGNGLWPAFWAFPEDSVYGQYAASGEIDIMELRDSLDKITSGIHYGSCEPGNLRNMTRTFSDIFPSFAGEAFVFGIEWSLDTIVFTINGVETTRRVSKALDPENGWFSGAANAKVSSPFDEPFHVIYNIAVGGNFPKYKPDDTTPEYVIMSIDYFRVFAEF